MIFKKQDLIKKQDFAKTEFERIKRDWKLNDRVLFKKRQD